MGRDLIGLVDGLTFDDLSIYRKGSSTVILADRKKLATLKGVGGLSEESFVIYDDSTLPV